MGKRIFLFKTKSGSEYLVILSPGEKATFDLLLLVQLAGGDRRREGGWVLRLPEVGKSFKAYYQGYQMFRISTSTVVEVREI